jgi:tetratricopeptide (TPR) repeat protein
MKGLFKKSIKSLKKPGKDGATVVSTPPAPSSPENPSQADDHHDNSSDEYTQKLQLASQQLQKTIQRYRERNSNSAQGVLFDAGQYEFTATSSPEQLANLIQTIVSQDKRKDGLLRRVSETAGKIYPLASLVLRLGTAVGEAFQPVKALMSSLTIVLDLSEQERSQAKDFQQTLESVMYQCSRIAEIQRTTVDGGWNHLVIQKSTQLLTAIIQYFNESITFFGQGPAQILGASILFGQDRYTGVKAALNHAVVEYDQALLLQIAVSAISNGTQPDEAISVSHKAKKNTDKAELLKWLRASYWETEAQLMNSCKQLQEGSFSWIPKLEPFTKWRRNKTHGLWLTAAPGFGKSVLAAHAVQLLKAEHPEAAVLYFFCRRTNPQLNTWERLVHTLASQIVMSIPSTQEYFQDLQDRKYECEDASLIFETFIVAPLSKVDSQVFVVVDGIDECLFMEEDLPHFNDKSSTILESLTKLQCQCLLTSRPMPISKGKLSLWLHHRLTTENLEDIRLFTSKRVCESTVLQSGFERLGQHAETLVVEKGQNNFLWVSTVLNLLDKPGLSTQEFKDLLSDNPSKLNQAYIEVLDRIDQAGSLELARIIIGCVLFSQFTLTIEALETIVSILHGEINAFREFIEVDCGSILTIIAAEDDRHVVQITHETFRAFITSRDLSSSRSLPAPSCHLHLVMAYLECLTDPRDKKVACIHDHVVLSWFQHFTGFQDQKETNVHDPMFIKRLLIKVHKFFTVEELLCAWLKQFIFLTKDETRSLFLCYHLFDIHENILHWLGSTELAGLTPSISRDRPGDETYISALKWRNHMVSSEVRDLAHFICRCLARTWLGTNWKESGLSSVVFLQTKKTAQILLWNEIAGDTNRFASHSDYASTTASQVQRLGKLGGFLPFIGLHSGNYAFGHMMANDPSCPRYFLSALDEYPDWWHLHDGLGNWYYRINDKTRAVETLEKAIKYNSQLALSAGSLYWVAKCELFLETGYVKGAIETLHQAEQLCSEKEAYQYWRRMAQILEDRNCWDEVKTVYTDALNKRSLGRYEYWTGLSEAYSKLGDWRGALGVLYKALRDKSQYRERYMHFKKICRLATGLRECFLFDQSIEVLRSAMTNDPDNEAQYHTLIANTYMAAGRWSEAVEAYKSILSGWKIDSKARGTIYVDLGDAHLAMGRLEEAVAAYGEGMDQSDDATRCLPSKLALGYMIVGQFAEAIRILRRCITATHMSASEGFDDNFQAGVFMGMQLNLGKCFEAIGRYEDSKSAYMTGIGVVGKIKDGMKNMPEQDDSETPVWRYNARFFVAYGELLERTGSRTEAIQQYEVAETIMSKTRFVEDDDILEWEYVNCLKTVARIRGDGSRDDAAEKVALEKMLQLNSVESYRIQWYSFMNSGMPRYRGGEEGWAARIRRFMAETSVNRTTDSV